MLESASAALSAILAVSGHLPAARGCFGLPAGRILSVEEPARYWKNSSMLGSLVTVARRGNPSRSSIVAR